MHSDLRSVICLIIFLKVMTCVFHAICAMLEDPYGGKIYDGCLRIPHALFGEASAALESFQCFSPTYLIFISFHRPDRMFA